jgi:hypothetical protein
MKLENYMNDEKRKHPRLESEGLFRIYTNLTNCAYTVGLRDISKEGAFIKTKHLPEIDDIITYVVLDDDGKERIVGNAKVVRVSNTGADKDIGFAIKLESQLVDTILEDLKK